MPDHSIGSDGREIVATSTEQSNRPGRRDVIKIGAMLIPTIATLHATPAWAETDYTRVAYRYGTHAGLCRNRHYNPNASPHSYAGQEFVECRTRPGGSSDGPNGAPSSGGDVGKP